MQEENLEKIQADLEKEEERNKEQKMPQSGRSVFEIKRIKDRQAKKDRES